MLSLIAVLALVCGQEQDAAKQMAELCKKTAAAGSLTFKIEAREEGGFREDGVQVTDGHFKKGLPVHLKHGEIEAYRDQDQMVYQAAKDKWEVFDAEEAFRGGGGGDREQMFALFTLSVAFLPHEVLKGLAQKVADVEREERDGKVIFSGKLNEKGADEFSGAARLREMSSRFGGNAPELKVSGTWRLTVGAEGALEELLLETVMAGSWGERDFERTSENKMSLSAIGKTELEVPDAVLACFEL